MARVTLTTQLAEAQTANDGLSLMLANHMRELERLRGFLHVLAVRGDSIGKAATLMLERDDVTAATLATKGLL